VAIVHLGRATARGNSNRVATWVAVTAAAGLRPLVVDLAIHAGLGITPRRVSRLLTGEIVPETFAWQGRLPRADLALSGPAAVVFVTARAYDPTLLCGLGPRPAVVLDFVDRLSESYRQRAIRAASPLRRAGYRGLRVPMARFERREHSRADLTTAAGYRDAPLLGAEWLPNVLERLPAPVPPSRSDGADGPVVDLVFHGTLSYPPNSDALSAFAAAWPLIRRSRPGTRLLVAGSRPAAGLAAWIRAQPGWELTANFDDLNAVLRRARVAVAPLVSATGLQNKVLETTARALPTVASPAAAAGFDQRFPLALADTPAAWAAQIRHLLDAPGAAAALGAAQRRHVAGHYLATCWAPWLRAALAAKGPSGRAAAFMAAGA